MEDILSVTIPEGGFELAKDLKGSPIPDDDVLENIRQSAEYDAPIFTRQPKREGSFIYCGGGVSIKDYIDTLRERKNNGEFIITSNKTYDYLIDNGIVPNACFVLDPKKICATYITKPQKETIFYIATVCNKQVAVNLLEAGCTVNKMLVGYGIEGETDVVLQKTLYPKFNDFLCGGTMAGLRAMNLAPLMGFSKVEYYGFDSSFPYEFPKLVHKEDPEFDEVVKRNKGISYEDAETGKIYAIDEPEGGFFYAYRKKRSENLQIAQTPDGRRFWTTPCFAHQAKQAIKWIDRLEDKVEIIIHGDSLNSHLLAYHREVKRKALEGVGNKRWTNNYVKLQKDLHADGEYGIHGDTDIELVGRAILALIEKIDRKITHLDYGCGHGKLTERIQFIFNCVNSTMYDPFIEKYSAEPCGKYDILTCFDVMEHVEEQCVENTLKYIAEKTRYIAAFSIAHSDAVKVLTDGRNAHITQHHPEWWINRLNKYFIVVELLVQKGSQMFFVCQSLDANNDLEKETVVINKSNGKGNNS